MRRGEAFPSTYLSKEDLMNGPIVAVVSDVGIGAVKGEHGEEQKPVMRFSHPRDTKPMIVNGVNWSICEEAFGPESDDWRGKRVELYHDPNVMFGPKRVGGVRLRIPSQQSGNGAAGGPAVWGIMQAAAECEKAGIPRTELAAYLRANEIDKYNGEKHTAIVQAMIASRRPQVEESLDALDRPPPPPFGGEEIPF